MESARRGKGRKVFILTYNVPKIFDFLNIYYCEGGLGGERAIAEVGSIASMTSITNPPGGYD
jgi:hypothetical protein